MTHHVDLDTITLERGNHDGPTEGGCVMEWASYFAHEPWSDHPACVSPVIGAFLRRWNDDLDDDGRQMLVPCAAKVVGTNTGPADDERRAWMVTDWMVRTYLPAWLRLAKMDAQADTVEALPELVDPATWDGMRDTIGRVQKDSAAAWDAAWDAAEDAARAAAEDAARAAAWDALRPTTEGLQASALDLLDRLVAVGAPA